MKKLTYLLSALAFAAAIAVGTQAARAQTPMGNPNGVQLETSPSMDRDEVLVQMTALHTQQTDLLSEVMRNEYMDSSDLTASRDAVMRNAADISQLVNAEFGQLPQQVFEKYWNENRTLFLNYANGIQQADQAMQGDALVGLHRNIIEASAMIAAETNLPQERVDAALRAHVNNLRGVIESYAQGNYEASYSEQMMAQEQIAQVARTMTDALMR